MKENKHRIIESFQYDTGLKVDVDEGWPKITSSQFGGEPGRAFKELIQNAIDSYSSEIPIEERKGEITANRNDITITDYGSGLSLSKIKLLLTLGGTDKDNDPTKIGMFGIGFFSIFNPSLYTENVTVITRCEGQVIQLTFSIDDQKKKPHIDSQILRKKIHFSTQIKVHFALSYSVDTCLNHAEKSLLHYPCKFTINGKVFQSVWERAKNRGIKMYNDGAVSGFLENSSWHEKVTILCKFEYISTQYLFTFAKGGHNICNDLRDLDSGEMPYLKGHDATINNNALRLTISRDSYYLDYNFDSSVRLLRKMMLEKLKTNLDKSFDYQIIQANQYIFRYKIKNYLLNPESYNSGDGLTNAIVKILADASVFRLSDKGYFVSLSDMKKALSKDLPLFYSENNKNVRWLGGQFRHDFIVLTNTYSLQYSAPEFYKNLFGAVFSDIVDLDTIQHNNKKISELVERKIIDKSALNPSVKFVGEKQLNKDQTELLLEINHILRHKEVKEAIAQNIRIPVRNIVATFFEVRDEGAYISTGLFSQSGQPLSEDFITNFERSGDEEGFQPEITGADILLGLRLNQPFIDILVESKNTHKAYFTLTYLAHELAMCQKLLVPYSPFYHFVKEKTATAMRKALINQMLNQKEN